MSGLKRTVEWEPNFVAGFLCKAGTLVAAMFGSESVETAAIKNKAVTAAKMVTPWKMPVVYASTATLKAKYEATSEVLKSETNAEREIIDGKNWAKGQRILLQYESESKHNGIYEVVKAGTEGGEKWELKRTADANTTAELQDATVSVESGTQNKGMTFCQVATVATVGTTAQEWLPDGVGPWAALESLSAKLEADASNYTPDIRLEQNGAVARLRGVYAVKAGEKLPSGSHIFTVPEAFRPTKPLRIVISTPGPGVAALILATNGEVVIGLPVELAAAAAIYMDGTTWSLT